MINVVAMKRQDCSVEKYRNSVTKNTNGTAIGIKNANASFAGIISIYSNYLGIYKGTFIILSNVV